MSQYYVLEFEKPVTELEKQIEALDAELAATPPEAQAAIVRRIDDLRSAHQQTLKAVYSNLTAWETVRVARHPKRPQSRDYIEMICKDFVELAGDRRFGDDPAMVTGFARIGPHKVLIVGHQKGRNTTEKIACHFGSLVDTPGAYPGIGAEQRGQAEAIAVNLREMTGLRVPIISVVIGEGGSGGALGIAVANRVAMLSNAWYSVISPEGCAAILWKAANEQTNTAAATALKLTAADNLRLGIVDAVIAEPLGGAHRDPNATARALEQWIIAQVADLKRLDGQRLVDDRYARFRKLGAFAEQADTQTPLA